MKLRIYTDTSVLGGCEDEEFAEHSVRLLESFVTGERVLVLSSLTVQELAAAPAEVRKRLAAVPEAQLTRIRNRYKIQPTQNKQVTGCSRPEAPLSGR